MGTRHCARSATVGEAKRSRVGRRAGYVQATCALLFGGCGGSVDEQGSLNHNSPAW